MRKISNEKFLVWLNTQGVYEQFCSNCKLLIAGGTDSVEWYMNTLLEDFRNQIMPAFDWDSSVEGYDHWCVISDNYDAEFNH